MAALPERRVVGVRRMVRRLARGLLALAPAAVPACYRYVPLESAPAPGIVVQVELNDEGRVGMASAVGPAVGKIEGVLDSRSDSAMVVRVTRVQGEYGGVARWEGEPVEIRTGWVRTLREREFSAGRTALVAALAGGGFVAFVATRDLLGFGGTPGTFNPVNTGGGKSQ